MLKKYYSVSEAAEYLSSQSRTSLGIRDVIELAARSAIRLCFWADTDLHCWNEDGDLLPFAYSFRGYPRILPYHISPTSRGFDICDVWEVVEIISAEARTRTDGLIPPPLTFGRNGAVYGSTTDLPFGPLRGLMDRSCPSKEFADRGTFRLTIEDIFIPAIDLLQKNLDPAHVGDTRGATWPKYDTQKLTALRMAAVKFWSNYDPNYPDTAHKNDEVSEWLQTEYKGLIQKTLADAMATILRADGLKTGPRKK